jgi:hypothetical protein
MPPLPETANNFSVPAMSADVLPPVEQAAPRY